MPGSMLSEIATPRSDPGESAPARHASPSDNMITDERNETEKKNNATLIRAWRSKQKFFFSRTSSSKQKLFKIQIRSNLGIIYKPIRNSRTCQTCTFWGSSR